MPMGQHVEIKGNRRYKKGADIIWSLRPAGEKVRVRGLLFAVWIALLALIIVSESAAAVPAIAKITVVEGTVDVLKGGSLPAVSARVGDALYIKDIIRTKSSSRAEVSFVDGTLLKVAQRSRLDISEYVTEDPSGKKIVTLKRGKVEAVVPPGLPKDVNAASRQNRFEVHTPNAVAGVRGTDYIVFFDNNVTWVLVKEGTVNIVNPAFPDQTITVTAGQLASVPLSQPPVKKDATDSEKKMIEQASKSRGTSTLTTSGTTGGTGSTGGTGGTGGTSGTSGTGGTVSELSGTGFESTSGYSSGKVVIEVVTTPPPPPPPAPPAVEVGRTSLSGSLVAGPSGQFDFISVIMKDVIFLAPSTGQAPTIWNTGSISGSYRFGGSITNGVSSIPVSDGRGITGNFNISQWSANAWLGTVGAQGSLSGGLYNGPVSMQGIVSGSHSGGTSGSFTGTGSGAASK